MYELLLFFHTYVRYLLLASLLYAIYRAYNGYTSGGVFSKKDNAARHWTATIAHIQLLIGMVLYFKSPVTSYLWNHFNEAVKTPEYPFFGIVHMVLMLVAIVFLTLGSAVAKRKKADSDKFKTILVWFSIALLIILIAIPWPFSPFTNRPLFR